MGSESKNSLGDTSADSFFSDDGEDSSTLSSDDDFDPEEYSRNRAKRRQEEQAKWYKLQKESGIYDSDSDADDEDGGVTSSGQSSAGSAWSGVPTQGSKWVEDMAKKAQDIPEELFTLPLKKTSGNVLPETVKGTSRNEEQQRIHSSTPSVGAAAAPLQNADAPTGPVVRNQPTTNPLVTVRKDGETAPIRNTEPQIAGTLIDAIDPFQGKTLRHSNNIPTGDKENTRQAAVSVSSPIQTSSRPRKRSFRGTDKSMDSVQRLSGEEVKLLDEDEPIAKRKRTKTVRKEPASKLPTVKKPVSVASQVTEAPREPPSKAKRKSEEKLEQAPPKRARRQLRSTSSESEPIEVDLQLKKAPSKRQLANLLANLHLS